MSRLQWTWLALAALAAVGSRGAEAPVTARASLGQWQERALTHLPDQKGRVSRSRTATLQLGANEYRIKYSVATEEGQPDRVFPVEGYLGMPVPCSTGWYHSGFLFIRINGQDIGSTPLSSMTVVEEGERGTVDLVWHHEAASVRARLIGLAGDDKLLVEIAIQPKTEITAVSVVARCYPSFFTSWHKRVGARRVQTPGALVMEGEPQTLPAADNWWLAYYDEVFDVARGEGDGPCAMAVLPEEAAEIKVEPGGYAVTTTVTYRPEVRRMRLAFWEFGGEENATVLGAMPAKALAAAEALRTGDFTPQRLAATDFAALHKEIAAVLASPGGRAALGDRAQKIAAWLDEHAPLLGQPPAQADVAAAEKLLAAIDQYREHYWEVKLAQLLDF